jgi:DNA repair protein RecN (Recombination protein N)
MLKFLKINNIALISSLELELGPGLTLLTGETGAGKSILVDALGLLAGNRASGDDIRTGAERASVEALFESPDVPDLLEPLGLPHEGNELVLRREIQPAGKGRASVNGALTPIATLRTLAPHLLRIHGQHEPQGLLDPETHLGLLDRHAGIETTGLAPVFGRLRHVEGELRTLRSDQREHERRREMLEFQAGEIERASIGASEEESLRQEKQVQANAGRLAALSGEAYGLLYDDEAAVIARLGQVYKRVEELAAIDPRAVPYLEARGPVKAQIEDLALFLRDYGNGLSVTPGRLDEIENRLALIERLKRKYGATADEVLAFGARCRAELDALGPAGEREAALQQERDALAKEYVAGARVLSDRRRSAARVLEKKVQAELAQLAMEKTRFRVQFEPEAAEQAAADPSTWTEHGFERASFLLSPNLGEELRPLARIASGGELSRILLALNSLASLEADGTTLVFDEVDAGIGGAVAEVVGRKLRALAERHQVLCVTHLPQVAAFAERHLAVRKSVERGRTLTEVRILDARERVEELARMLGGERITDAARKHAEELVKQNSRSIA